jgi:glycosyltransferase involved in cell wall biosynthesis
VSNKRKRVLVICPYPENSAAGQRLKYEQYFESLSKQGYSFRVSPFLDDKIWNVLYKDGHLFIKLCGLISGYFKRIKTVFDLGNYDLVYVFMWVTPVGPPLFERVYRFFSKKIIFDVEDNFIDPQVVPNSDNRNLFLKFLMGNSKQLYLAKYADFVITSSEYISVQTKKINKFSNSIFISSSIDAERFFPTNKYLNNKQIVIGWTGTYSTKMHLDLLKEVFIRLARKIDFKLRVISNFNYDINGVDVESIQWSEVNEVRDLQGIDIGVYPLPDEKFVLGKSGLKAIQYMSFGLPIVATAIGTTNDIIEDNVNGRLVESEEEWIEKLYELIVNPDLRKRLGERARQDMLEKYSTKAIYNKYLTILNATLEI